MSQAMEAKVIALVDQLLDNGPLTKEEVCDAEGWSWEDFYAIKLYARRQREDRRTGVRSPSMLTQLGVTLVCEMHTPWRYSVEPEFCDDANPDIEGWLKNRLDDGATRCRTLYEVATKGMALTNRRSPLYRKAGHFYRHIGHLLDNIDALNEEIREMEEEERQARQDEEA